MLCDIPICCVKRKTL
uniref:Uncharacterized protein n=1 Tax=Anguilla anguilla TaxID=7936 RepID=A0A0E9SHH0_ANGAN